MMSRLYGEQHRSIQDDFGTRGMADRVEELVCRTEFDDGAKGFIESVEMFYLSSIDHQGRPTVSYKGGDAGFVKVIDNTTLIFPSYDGNGMFFLWAISAPTQMLGYCLCRLKRLAVYACKVLQAFQKTRLY